jgi:hypothetical protein
MTENAPPEKGKGLASNTDKALYNDHHHRSHHHERSVSQEVGSGTTPVKTNSGTSGENIARHLLARLKVAIAAQRSTPKMHWRWRLRGRDIVALLQSRFGSALPDDDAGLDAAELIAHHYMRLNIDAERVTRANLRLWASWLTENAVARLITGAKKAKTPSASQLGKHWRVTAGEVVDHRLTTITAFLLRLKATASDKLAAGEMPAPRRNAAVRHWNYHQKRSGHAVSRRKRNGRDVPERPQKIVTQLPI